MSKRRQRGYFEPLWDAILFAFCVVVLVAVFGLFVGCAPVAAPQCSAERPQDCAYLMKVYGERPWFEDAE